MIRSEIVRKLIRCAYDGETPYDGELTLGACLDLYAALRIEEGRQPTFDDLFAHNTAPEPEATFEPDESPPAAQLQGFQPIAAQRSPAAAAAAFKRETHERLRAYHAAHGLGGFVDLAADCGNGIDEITLGRMHSGERFPIDVWRSVAAALDKFENKEL